MYGKKYMGAERSTFLIDRDLIIKRIWRKVKVDVMLMRFLMHARSWLCLVNYNAQTNSIKMFKFNIKFKKFL